MKRERAYVDARRSQIIEILRSNPLVRVDTLAQRLGVSVITIRRDLQYLEDNGMLTRFYGGARATEQISKSVDEVEICRELIARHAASLVEDGDTIFINTSRNALDIISYITKDI